MRGVFYNIFGFYESMNVFEVVISGVDVIDYVGKGVCFVCVFIDVYYDDYGFDLIEDIVYCVWECIVVVVYGVEVCSFFSGFCDYNGCVEGKGISISVGCSVYDFDY